MNVRVALLQIASQHTKSGQRGVAGCPGIPGQIKSVWVAGSPRNTQLLSLAAVYEGMNRTEAAKVGGMDRQTLRNISSMIPT